MTNVVSWNRGSSRPGQQPRRAIANFGSKTLVRERYRHGCATALVLLLAGVGCGGEKSLRIITAVVEQPASGSAMESAVAWTGEEPIAVDLIDASGRFVLTVPQESMVMITLGTAAGEHLEVEDESLWTCVRNEPIDLGTLVEVIDDGPCPSSAECESMEEFLNECVEQTNSICDQIAEDVQRCHVAREVACAPEREALDQCLQGGPPPCMVEQEMLDGCERAFCDAPESAFIDTCLVQCEEERRLRDEVCLPNEAIRCADPETRRFQSDNPAPAVCPEEPI